MEKVEELGQNKAGFLLSANKRGGQLQLPILFQLYKSSSSRIWHLQTLGKCTDLRRIFLETSQRKEICPLCGYERESER